jgi:RNA polymerase sigma-70 factor (ECF subfamily)
VKGERALIDRAIDGEDQALGVLVAAHRPVVVRTAFHLLGDAELAEDVAQEVFLRLPEALPGFRGDAKLSTWLDRVTLNRCRDQLRRRRRRTLDVHTPTAASLLATEDHPAHALDTERARAAVLAAVDRLPEDQKEAIMLRYVSDLSYADIARVTSTPQGTVASRVFRGLKRLGEDLDARHLEVVK